jgi:hypothetical protein
LDFENLHVEGETVVQAVLAEEVPLGAQENPGDRPRGVFCDCQPR